MAVADMEYRAEKKARKKAYSRLKQIAKLQGKKPPPIPYPSAVKEIQAEERKFVRDRFYNPEILKIVEKMEEERAAVMQDRRGAGGWWLVKDWSQLSVSDVSSLGLKELTGLEILTAYLGQKISLVYLIRWQSLFFKLYVDYTNDCVDKGSGIGC